VSEALANERGAEGVRDFRKIATEVVQVVMQSTVVGNVSEPEPAEDDAFAGTTGEVRKAQVAAQEASPKHSSGYGFLLVLVGISFLYLVQQHLLPDLHFVCQRVRAMKTLAEKPGYTQAIVSATTTQHIPRIDVFPAEKHGQTYAAVSGTASHPVPQIDVMMPLVREFTQDIYAEDKSFLKERQKSDKCKAKMFGSGYGKHMLCAALIPTGKCTYFSYGVNYDFSFETDMDGSKCKGFSLDPTVSHPHHLTQSSTFLKIGAPMLHDSPFPTSSPVLLANTSGFSKLSVLKMDCEGCEYKVADGMLGCSPGPGCDRHFFDRVDQFAVEFHLPKRFIRSQKYLDGLAKLLWLLQEAGLQLIDAGNGGCGPPKEVIDEVKNIWGVNARFGCSNFLFARIS